jgi:predicted ATPase
MLNPIGASFEVALADTGAGMGQVLPVLTAIAAAQENVRNGAQEIVAIEEPESQLHPNAQRALGEWMCEVAGSDSAPQLVLETHSRVLVLAVQLAIARGLDPQRVALYWLEQRSDGSTHAREVTLDRHGRPDSQWPRDVFADELELADELAEQQFSSGAWDT